MSKPRQRHPRTGVSRTGVDHGRRDVLSAAAAIAASLALSACGTSSSSTSSTTTAGETSSSSVADSSSTTAPPQTTPVAAALPNPEDSGIDHVVLVMMENRSFDHYLGWVPGADGRQAGTQMTSSDGKTYSSFDLAPQYQNCNLADPDHSYQGWRIEINGGAMNGFLLTQPPGDAFPIGYYTAESLPFFKGCADHWTICDHYHSGILSSTTPNRIYMHAGQTDRLDNSVVISTLPTVWDRMMGAGRSVAYYYADDAYVAFWGNKYKNFSHKYTMQGFAADVASKPLPDLMYIDNVSASFDELLGVSRDDHPYADIRDGQAFLNQVYDILRKSPDWGRTLMIINYDEGGGFYDHVVPTFAPISTAEKALGNDGRLGVRVPCVLLGPRAKRGHVEHTPFDPNSILNMLAWRFGFEPLGVRKDSANIALALDFTNPPNASTPAFTVKPGPFGGICLPTGLIGGADNPILKLPLPPLPLPVNVPIPLPNLLPPLPGLDLPVGTASSYPVYTASQRRVGHQAELAGLRTLGRQYGF
ncbi:MAG TPA: alkaline phosphatase family protein [Nevskiaceae bacterium]|nr:alkaline phosphatase family protein [Nevskiaceae bacterium]